MYGALPPQQMHEGHSITHDPRSVIFNLGVSEDMLGVHKILKKFIKQAQLSH